MFTNALIAYVGVVDQQGTVLLKFLRKM